MDREKVINSLTDMENILIARQDICPPDELQYWIELQEGVADALALLKEQDKRYAMMVVDWLRDMAHNNYLDLSHMTFWDAILDIRERAQTGLENYFRDYDFDIKQQEGR